MTPKIAIRLVLCAAPVLCWLGCKQPNRPPQPAPDNFTVAEDTQLVENVLTNDSDPDGDSLHASVVSMPTHGSLDLREDGSFTYVPAADYYGLDGFQYRASDGQLTSDPVDVTLTVTPVNDPPRATADAYSVSVDGTLNVDATRGVLANDSDVDRDVLTAELVSSTTHGALTLRANGSFTYVPQAGYIGPDSFTYQARDAELSSGPVQVSLTVRAGNAAPVANADAYSTPEDVPLTVAAAAGVLADDTDADGDILTATVLTTPANGILMLQPNGAFMYTPNANFHGTDSFTYEARDAAASSGPATVTLTVTSVNDPPVTRADSYQAFDGRTLTVPAATGVLANDSDVDGDTLSATVAMPPAHGMLTLAADGSFTYTPTTGYAGPDSFTYRASDGAASTDGTVSIVVRQVFSLAWAKRAGGTGDEQSGDVGVLADGSAIVVGAFAQSATFGAMETNATTLTSAGNLDIFIARYDPNGALVWAKRAGGSSEDRAIRVAVLADGTAYVTGYFNGTATFGPGEAAQTSLTSAGGQDVFVAKYAANGALAWARRAGSTQSDSGQSIALASDGSVLVAGDFAGIAVFGQGEANQTTLTAPGTNINDAFLARYGADGALAWAKQAGGTGVDGGRGIAGLSDGTVLVTGYFSGTATFGPGEAGQRSLTASGFYDFFLAKYASNGTLAWVVRAGGNPGTQAVSRDIAVFADGSSLVVGSLTNSVTFGGGEANQTVLTSVGSFDCFFARYAADGQLTWARNAGGLQGDGATAVAALSDGSALVTGMFNSTLTFPGWSPATLTTAGGSDVFLLRLGADGSLGRVTQSGGTLNDTGLGVGALSGGGAIVFGDFLSTAVFGAGDPAQTSLVSAGQRDVFLAKYTP